jgi:hypothetical protein
MLSRYINKKVTRRTELAEMTNACSCSQSAIKRRVADPLVMRGVR